MASWLDGLNGAEDDRTRTVREAHYPPALEKACCDPFEYVARLTTGEVLHFRSADPIDRDWVHLKCGWLTDRGIFSMFDRGVDIRVDQIAWVADAPSGS